MIINNSPKNLDELLKLSTCSKQPADINRIEPETIADKNILVALQSQSINECEINILENIIIEAVAKAYADTGQKPQKENIDWIVANLPESLLKQLPKLKLFEIPLAIEAGILKEYGDYFGINVAELTRFCRAYYYSDKRASTVKSIKPIELPKGKPTPEQKFYLYLNNLIEAFEKSKTGSNYEANAPALYDFVNSLGLIIFSTKEKYDIMADACKVLIHEQKLKLAFLVNDFDRKPLNRIIQQLELSLSENKPVEADIKNMIIAKSKKITLDAFFHEINLNEFDISDIINAKKEIYLNL